MAVCQGEHSHDGKTGHGEELRDTTRRREGWKGTYETRSTRQREEMRLRHEKGSSDVAEE